MGRTLIITNDFPPRMGGIETFVYELASRLDPARVVVLTASMPGADAVDRGLAFPVHRLRTSTLLPVRQVRRAAEQLIERYGCDSVWFGAAAPLGLLGSALRANPQVKRVVASTHGHERTWARIPAGRVVLRRIAAGVDVLTYISEPVRAALAAAIPHCPARLVRLTPGVDLTKFSPADAAPGGGEVRGLQQEAGANNPATRPDPSSADAAPRVGEGAVVVCVARLVKLKGQDVLLRAWARVAPHHPDATLLLVGGGPRRKALQAEARRLGLDGSVHFTGPVPYSAIPDLYRAADVAALLTRPVAAGLVLEGLGAVTLEASACGVPVIVGRTGGAIETVRDGVTGYLVDPRDEVEVAGRINALLADRPAAQAMGAAGREWMTQEWSWQDRATQIAHLLTPTP
ncbi:MAG: glycosyltransferase family 4 protein [Bifidobacteriaceae bacterium]|jgi:phosphatidylinositol alpha-1,6-mannosyltransferase|nr:glycosyltransferase family 4 protein [Bifidobacteriaceae bacterium]